MAAKEVNKCHLCGVVTGKGQENVMCGEVSRPVLHIRTFDSEEEIVEVRVVLSSLQQIRNCSGIKEGDLVEIDGCIGEFPIDQLIFYPAKLRVEKGSWLISDSIIANSVRDFPNYVMISGKVKKIHDQGVTVTVKHPKFLRGELRKSSAIFVNCQPRSVHQGSRVFFTGEITRKGLVGEIFL